MIPEEVVDKKFELYNNTWFGSLDYYENYVENEISIAKHDFKAGILLAEKYIKEFAEWIGRNEYTYFNPKDVTPSWFDSEDRSLDCNTEELFKIFWEEKYGEIEGK